MKFLSGSSVIILLLAMACSPKNEEVRTEQALPRNPEKVTETEIVSDSVLKPKKDGTATVHTHEAPRLPLPQPVLQLLEQTYPAWQEPVLLEESARFATEKDQGPLIVKGDFNGDELQDIALQIRHQRDVLIVALLQDSTRWHLYELKKDILFNDRGTYKSLYYVYRTDAGSSVFNHETRKDFNINHDAVSVGIGNSATTFIYEDGKFEAYDTGD